MVVIVLIVAALGVVLFITLSDTRKNNNFKQLEQRANGDASAADPAAVDNGDRRGAGTGD